MEIEIRNFLEREIVSYPLILIEGFIQNFNEKICYRSSAIIITHHSENENITVVGKIMMNNLNFKTHVRLFPGDNKICLDFFGVKQILKIKYFNENTSNIIRLVYVVCNDCDGKFQSPPDMDNSIQDSIERLQTASLVWQSCMAQLLLEQGHGRKTFSFESENGKPIIYIHKTLLSRNETYQLNSHDVWKKIGKEIMVSEVGKKSKVPC